MANQIFPLNGSYATVYASAARTATPDSFEFELNRTPVGLVLVFDVTAVTSTPSTTVAILGVDRASGKTWNILTSTAIATAVTTILRVGNPQSGTPANNLIANEYIPSFVRIAATHGNANSMTYSVGLHVIE